MEREEKKNNKVFTLLKNRFSKHKKEKITNNDIKITNCVNYISIDDAYILLLKLYSNNTPLSGLELNAIFDGIYGSNYSIDVSKTISNVRICDAPSINNHFFEIKRRFICNYEALKNNTVENFSDDFFALQVKPNEFENKGLNHFDSGFNDCYIKSDLKYYVPSKDLIDKGEEAFQTNGDNADYYDAVSSFYVTLTEKCFSCESNHHYKILVLKLLFSSFTKNQLHNQNRILAKAHDYLNASFERMFNTNSEKLIEEKLPQDTNYNQEESMIDFDAIIVCNAFCRTYNSIPLDYKKSIKNLYNSLYNNNFYD